MILHTIQIYKSDFNRFKTSFNFLACGIFNLQNFLSLYYVKIFVCFLLFRDVQETGGASLSGIFIMVLSGNSTSSSKDMWLTWWPSHYSTKNKAQRWKAFGIQGAWCTKRESQVQNCLSSWLWFLQARHCSRPSPFSGAISTVFFLFLIHDNFSGVWMCGAFLGTCWRLGNLHSVFW